ncbi:CbiX/SirB N-terminal domain-containing protein [Halocatena halophila]|uniref:CbiX/SirB N-terminal domain-containing protein n=1 Tax=Halocatena halophila TaxID=2814576 RepID=UPI002ED226CD
MTRTASDEAIVLVGHGSRRERSNEQVRALAAEFEAQVRVPVDVAFLELASPSIGDAIDGLAPSVSTVTVLPLSLFGASHVKADLPLAVNQARDRHPELQLEMGGPIGVHPAVVTILDERVRATERKLGVDRDTDHLAVILCARGSSDPDANGDATKVARLLYEGRPFERVKTAFIGITEPTLTEGLHTIAKHRPDAVVVVPYMLGDGVLTQRIRDRATSFDGEYPSLSVGSAEPIGTDERLFDVLADRREQARANAVDLSCDTCKYKVDLDGFTGELGGAQATFRAVAHQIEHADRSKPHRHAHDAPERHVSVCTNRTCADDGALAVLEQLRQSVRDCESTDVQITRSSCLGQCGDGPMVAVYPDGVWYRGVSSGDAERIVSSHLDRDSIVTDRVHTVLKHEL